MQRDTTTAASQPWLVVHTHPHRERLAVENLERQHFTTYCPLTLKRLRARTGPRDVLRPLFPSYVFIRAHPDRAHWRPLLSTYGVRRLICFGEEIAYLDPRFIDALRAREVEGAIVKPLVPLVPGQGIRITAGPLDGLVAKILEVKSNDRLVILMDLLGQSVRGRIHAHHVAPLAPD